MNSHPQYAFGSPEEVLKSAVNHAYDQAKRWGGAVVGLQTALFLSGVVAVFAPSFTLSYPWIALPLMLVSAWLSSQVSKYKEIAEDAKRRHEMLIGFGVEPSADLLADLNLSLPKKLKPAYEALLREGITYASQKPAGPIRVLENLVESAWYSKHLAWSCANLLRGIFAVSLSMTIALLLLSAIDLSGTAIGIAAARSVAATLTFLISVGILRGLNAYVSYSAKAGQIDSHATRLLQSGREIERFEAQFIVSEYQLARASAPLIPTWVWRARRNALNQNWKIKKPTSSSWKPSTS